MSAAGGRVAKLQVTLRLDPGVVQRFRAGGPGWQGRINEALGRAVRLQTSTDCRALPSQSSRYRLVFP
jgi:uncharacterized protein (DUF4415 family)